MKIKTLTLLCPDCHQGLKESQSGIVCEACHRDFPLIGGRPALFPLASIFNRISLDESGLKRSRWRNLKKYLPRYSHNLAAKRVLARFAEEMFRKGGAPVVLVIGAGTGGVGHQLLESEHLITLRSDIFPFEGIDILADAHGLPFQDLSIDGVVIQAVLEHVLEPERVLLEIRRVLKPDGLIYAETPFMQMVHEKAFDYTRYSDLGHRYLFRHFHEIERGMIGGPGMTLLWAWCYFLRSFFSGWIGTQIGFAIGRITGFWLLWVDRLLMSSDRPSVHDAASGYYFLGKRSQSEVIDHQRLIEEFRGYM